MYDIMIVDDDPSILDIVELTLKREGYQVLRANSGREALRALEMGQPDLLVVDSMLPDIDGVSLVKTLRSNAETAYTPIIFLSGLTDTDKAVEALNSGGDDYLRKPVVPRELAARVRAHIRRASQFSDVDAPLVRIFPSSFRVFVNDREVGLTRVEFDLLKHLCKTPYEPHSTEDLLANVWQYPDGVGDAALVRNHIHNLRRKMEHDPERPAVIQSRHGRGYVIKARVQFEDEYAYR
jgi:DNA-binding response OmpR family regulator